MSAGISARSSEVRAVVEKAKMYELNPEVKEARGKRFTVTEVLLKDGSARTCSVAEHIFRMLGVDTVRRVTPPQVTVRSKHGDYNQIRLGSITIGAGLPCLPVIGPCTVDISVGKIAKKLADCGVKAIRGGCWKPRSNPYSFPGFGEQALYWLLKAAKDTRMEAVFTEVIESHQIKMVEDTVKMVGYKGTVVLWVGARTSNLLLLRALGNQHQFPVMLKHGLDDEKVDDLFARAEWVLAGEQKWLRNGRLDNRKSLRAGNQKLILCLRGLRNQDPQSMWRFSPNNHWAETIQAHSWAPVAIDPSHSAGTMDNDLVFMSIADALVHNPAMILVEGGYPENGSKGLCDAAQSIPIGRIPEVLKMVDDRNRRLHDAK